MKTTESKPVEPTISVDGNGTKGDSETGKGKIKTPTSDPNGYTKLKCNQGYKDKNGDIWKKVNYIKTIGILVIKRVRRLKKLILKEMKYGLMAIKKNKTP